MDKSRRNVSKLMLLAFGATTATGLNFGYSRSVAREWRDIVSKMVGKYGDFHELGRRCIYYNVASDKLVKRLFSKFDEKGFSQIADNSLIPTYLELVDEDFATGEVLNLDGWILSKSEIALSVAAVLMSDEHVGYR